MSRASGAVDVWDPSVPVEQNAYYWKDEPVVQSPRNVTSTADCCAPTVVELFCGLGGFSQGFIQAGFRVVLGGDIHQPSIASYANNHPDAVTILGDLRKVSGSILRSAVPTDIDVVLAGVPCQGFSLSNRKRHDGDERNQLFRDAVRLAKALNPHAMVIENVSGMRSAGRGSFVEAVREEIEGELGLRCHVMLLDAADFGVPQFRRRLFFVALPPGSRWTPPRPTHGPSTARAYRTVSDAISDLPPLLPGETATRYLTDPISSYAQLMRNGCRTLTSHEAPSHTPATLRRIAATSPGEPMYPSFRQRVRLAWDRPSPTQISGGIRPQFQFAHPSQDRGLTVRESARIQSFPDSTVIAGGMVQGRVQVGNAVPPLLAQRLAETVLVAMGW